MRIIIAGSRTFKDYDYLEKICNLTLSRFRCDITIVCGMADGADTLGYNYAYRKRYAVAEFPADWDTLGNVAGHIRNREMAEYSDMLIAFWDGKSTGTKNMIAQAKDLGLQVLVINYNNKQTYI